MPHEGQEFGYVLQGKIKVYYGKKSFVVNKGETFYFTTNKLHYIENIENGISEVIWVSSPPNF